VLCRSGVPSIDARYKTLCAAIPPNPDRVVVAVHSCRSEASGFVWRPRLVVTADEALADEGDIAVLSRTARRSRPNSWGETPRRTSRCSVSNVRTCHQRRFRRRRSRRVPSRSLWVRRRRANRCLRHRVALGRPWRSLRGGAIDARLELDVSLRRCGEGGLALDAAGRAFGMARPPSNASRRSSRATGGSRAVISASVYGRSRSKAGALGRDGHQCRPTRTRRQSGHTPPRRPERRADPVCAIASARLGPNSVGRTVTVGLRRAGETQQVSVTITERPAA
jgi:hypothetical protein